MEQVLSDWKEELTPEEGNLVGLDREVFTHQMARFYECSEKNMGGFVRLFYKNKQFANKMNFNIQKTQALAPGLIPKVLSFSAS